ncbi:MAG: DUF4062 domain-containing protein [Desulfobaccales bacterium]
MPRSETVLTVFVASPGDVAEERAILEAVIREFNVTWSKTLGLRLELIRWETNVYPDFGLDVQEVINKQIGDDYDIFIGIMWARYGTPTKQSESGTEEEFDRAYKRYKETGNVKIMFYFKDAPISPSKLDLDQYRAVSEFKSLLGDRSGLYWEFTESEEFRSLVRVHLSQVVQEWTTGKQGEFKNKPNGLLREQPQIILDANGEKLGYLDYIEKATESFNKVTEILSRISQYQEDFTKKINQRTEEIGRIPVLPPTVRMSAAKRIFQKSAEDMEEFVARTDVEIPIYSKAFEEGFFAFSNVITLSSELGTIAEKDIIESLEGVSSLIATMPNMIISIRELRSTIGNLPLMISRQNVAKRKIINTLNELARETDAGLNLMIEIKKTLQNKLPSPQSD